VVLKHQNQKINRRNCTKQRRNYIIFLYNSVLRCSYFICCASNHADKICI